MRAAFVSLGALVASILFKGQFVPTSTRLRHCHPDDPGADTLNLWHQGGRYVRGSFPHIGGENRFLHFDPNMKRFFDRLDLMIGTDLKAIQNWQKLGLVLGRKVFGGNISHLSWKHSSKAHPEHLTENEFRFFRAIAFKLEELGLSNSKNSWGNLAGKLSCMFFQDESSITHGGRQIPSIPKATSNEFVNRALDSFHVRPRMAVLFNTIKTVLERRGEDTREGWENFGRKLVDKAQEIKLA